MTAYPADSPVRALPHSVEAERAVLGASLQDPAALMQVMETLQAEDFFLPQHAALFKAMAQLFSQARSVDLVTMDVELTRVGALDGVGGTEYLIGLIRSVPTSAYLRHYVEIVLEKSTLRRLISASAEISRVCYDERLGLDETLLYAEKAVFDIVMKRTGSEQLTPIREVMKKTLSQIEELVRTKGQIAGVPTGFSYLDRLLTGLHGGELVMVGARPSMGKTSFAMNVAAHAARRGKSVAVFSLEMPKEQLALRLLCADARVDMQSVRFLSEEDLMRLRKAQRIATYIDRKIEEIERYNREHQIDSSSPVNGRRLTNLGTFRAYLVAYLQAHPGIHKDLIVMVRQLQPTAEGLPLEIYAFTRDTAWVNYENVQSDLFDHILAVVPEFGLRVFQIPGGNDLRNLGHRGLGRP